MRHRVAKLMAVMLVLWAGLALVPAAHAAPSHVVLAQQGGASAQGQGGSGGGESGAAEETGPPWTYQMARITAVLLVIIGILTGLMYYRFVVQRSRGR
jgi:hypothetical protein